MRHGAVVHDIEDAVVRPVQVACALAGTQQREVVAGVDTHSNTHHAAVVDLVGRLLSTREFRADPAGYLDLLSWVQSYGQVALIGVDGTGSYGAGLTRCLPEHQVRVIEVNRPDRRARRQRGKSDPLDAESAARRALAGVETVIPKDTNPTSCGHPAPADQLRLNRN